MRCPDCNKFVPYDEPEVEIQESSISGTQASINARVVLKCAECGSELKDSEIQADVDIEHDCPKLKDPDFEWDNEPVNGEPSERTQTTDRNGKPIKYSRYMKRFYGFTASGSVRCQGCNELIDLEFEGEEQASGFNELV